jgi:hypothetical protein
MAWRPEVALGEVDGASGLVLSRLTSTLTRYRRPSWWLAYLQMSLDGHHCAYGRAYALK